MTARAEIGKLSEFSLSLGLYNSFQEISFPSSPPPASSARRHIMWAILISHLILPPPISYPTTVLIFWTYLLDIPISLEEEYQSFHQVKALSHPHKPHMDKKQMPPRENKTSRRTALKNRFKGITNARAFPDAPKSQLITESRIITSHFYIKVHIWIPNNPK